MSKHRYFYREVFYAAFGFGPYQWGRPKSAEHRARISEGAKRRWAREKAQRGTA